MTISCRIFFGMPRTHIYKSMKRNSAPKHTHTHFLFRFFYRRRRVANVIHVVTATNTSIFHDSSFNLYSTSRKKGKKISDEWDFDGCCSNKKLCQMTQWNGKIICNHKKCEMNLINGSLFFDVYVYTDSSVKFLLLDHIFPFDSTWCLLVISLITLVCLFSHLPSSTTSFCCFCTVYICFFFLYFIYPSDSVETYSCCAMFILFMMRVYFILFNLLVWRSTNTNCEYFMNGKSSFRIKLFLWFDFQHT